MIGLTLLRKKKLGRNEPCYNNLVFEGFEFENGLYLDKDRVRANDAKLINSNCLRFNGIDNQVDITATLGNTWKFEVSLFWDATSSNYSSPICNPSTTGTFSIENNGNLYYVYIYPNSGIRNRIFTGTFPANRILNLEIEYNNGAYILNINGTEITGNIDHGLGFLIEKPYTIGRNSIYFFKGCIYRWNIENIANLTNCEGDGNKVYNRVDNTEYQINGTLTDVWSQKQDLVHNNIQNGFDLWKNNITDELLRVPYNVDNQSIKGENDTITGYSWLSSHPANPKVHNYAETQIDYTNDGVNTDIPNELNAWHPDNLSGLEGSQLFYKKDANKNTSLHLIYPEAITGACLEKTKKYTKWN